MGSRRQRKHIAVWWRMSGKLYLDVASVSYASITSERRPRSGNRLVRLRYIVCSPRAPSTQIDSIESALRGKKGEFSLDHFLGSSTRLVRLSFAS